MRFAPPEPKQLTSTLRRDLILLLSATLGFHTGAAMSTNRVSALDYPSIQAAIDANPGGSIHVPAGDYVLGRSLRITHDGTSLEGQARLIQTNRHDSVIRVDGARFVRVSGLTLTRPTGHFDTSQEGITVRNSRFVELEGLRVIDNRGPAGSIRVMDSPDSTVRGCLVLNYMIITVEDRTYPGGQGFAFKCIDGSGIEVVQSPRIVLSQNRVIEENLLPTPEVWKEYELGKIVKRQPGIKKPFTHGWHQGSGIFISDSSGEVTGNQIVNAAQGMDLHTDNLTVGNNLVEDSFMGMKAVHGSRNLIITGNQFVKPSLWGICLSPGPPSHPAQAASGNQPAREANVDGGTIVANNVITDFGYGRAAWNWKEFGTRAAIFLASNDESPLHDVIVEGNLVYDTGRDGVLVDGQPKMESPRYRYALMIDGKPPTGLTLANNRFAPGTDGISNAEIKP